MSCNIGINQFFGASPYIKFLNSDIVAIDGPNTIEKLIGNVKIPYQQVLRGRIVLKAGQIGYLMNHLGLGDNATFVAIIATYDTNSVNEEDNYLEYYYTDDTGKIRYMDQLMILTGNSTNRIPQLYFTNPNTYYKVTLDIMIAVIDDTYTFFPDTIDQTGLSFYNLQCNNSVCNIQTFITNESIVIFDNNSPQKPLVYLVLEDISSINISGQIISLDENTVGRVFLEFITSYDTLQAYSLINYVLNNPGIVIQNLVPLTDDIPPVVYLYEQVGNTASGNYITMGGLTGSWNTGTSSSIGITFSTSLSLAQYGGTCSTITKCKLSNLLIQNCIDNRDGLISLTDTNLILENYLSVCTDSITTTGTYSVGFNVIDLAGNSIASSTEIIISVTT